MKTPTLLTFALGIAVSSPCLASTFYTATLSGANESPANTSPATGSAMLTLNGDLLTVFETFTGLTAPAAAGHIHCCGPVGVNEPVVVPFTPFPAATSGTYSNTFNLSTFTFAVAGFTEAQLIAGLNSGMAYVNIHDANFPAGEIRGQIAMVTPEPSSLMLLGTGLLGTVGVLRRRVRF